MDNNKIYTEWFEFAKRDLESAKFLMNMHPRPIEIICYHCEQSAEKYLKGYLIKAGNKIERTHDLAFFILTSSGLKYLLNNPHVTSSISVSAIFTTIAIN